MRNANTYLSCRYSGYGIDGDRQGVFIRRHLLYDFVDMKALNAVYWHQKQVPTIHIDGYDGLE